MGTGERCGRITSAARAGVDVAPALVGMHAWTHSLCKLASQVNRLPVVGTRGKVVGVITRHDVLKGLYITSPLL